MNTSPDITKSINITRHLLMAFIGQFVIYIRGVGVERKVGEGKVLGMERKVWRDKISNLKQNLKETNYTLITGQYIFFCFHDKNSAFRKVLLLWFLRSCLSWLSCPNVSVVTI